MLSDLRVFSCTHTATTASRRETRVWAVRSMMSLRYCWVAMALLTSLAQVETLVGRVVAIADGDTLTLLDATNQPRKIRLAGIDASEKKQDFGWRTKSNLSTIALNKQPANADRCMRDGRQREICHS